MFGRHNREPETQGREGEGAAIFPTTSVQLKIATRDFSKTAGLTPIFEAIIVFYDQNWV